MPLYPRRNSPCLLCACCVCGCCRGRCSDAAQSAEWQPPTHIIPPVWLLWYLKLTLSTSLYNLSTSLYIYLSLPLSLPLSLISLFISLYISLYLSLYLSLIISTSLSAFIWFFISFTDYHYVLILVDDIFWLSALQTFWLIISTVYWPSGLCFYASTKILKQQWLVKRKLIKQHCHWAQSSFLTRLFIDVSKNDAHLIKFEFRN